MRCRINFPIQTPWHCRKHIRRTGRSNAGTRVHRRSGPHLDARPGLTYVSQLWRAVAHEQNEGESNSGACHRRGPAFHKDASDWRGLNRHETKGLLRHAWRWRVADTPAKHAAIAVTCPKSLRGEPFAILAARRSRCGGVWPREQISGLLLPVRVRGQDGGVHVRPHKRQDVDNRCYPSHGGLQRIELDTLSWQHPAVLEHQHRCGGVEVGVIVDDRETVCGGKCRGQ